MPQGPDAATDDDELLGDLLPELAEGLELFRA